MRITGILIVLLLTGCAGMTPREAPDVLLHEVHDFGATQLAFGTDSALLASGGYLGGIKVWRLPAVQLQTSLPGARSPVRGLVWDDADHLLAATADGWVRRWELPTRAVRQVQRLPALLGLAPFGTDAVLAVGKAGELRVLTRATLAERSRRVMDGRIAAFAVSATGDRIALAMHDGRVLLLDAALQTLAELPRPSRYIHSLRFSPDDTQLVGGAWFQWFAWSLDDATLHTYNSAHPGAIISFDYSPDGAELASLGRYTDSTLVLQSTSNQSITRHLRRHRLCGWQVRYSPDGRWLVSAGEDGSLHVYDRTRWTLPRTE